MRFRGDAGASTVEFVLAMPLLLLFVTASVQVGLWFHARQVAGAAATAGARAARAQGASIQVAGETAALRALDRDGPTMVRQRRVVVTATAATVTVVVSGVSPQVVPGFQQSVSASITAPIERF